MTPRQSLEQLAEHLWWIWDDDARALFATLAPATWERSNHAPLAVLADVDDATLDRFFSAQARRERLDESVDRLQMYLRTGSTWCDEEHPDLARGMVAYFCAEFALDESIPIYSGGLGVLAGDHIKTASDLGIPFVGVGLKYRQGYFQQRVNAKGDQHAERHTIPWDKMPGRYVERSGERVHVAVPLGADSVRAEIYEIAVGRARLLLLDTDIPQNDTAARSITHGLYSGDNRMRIRQETILGIGGVLALRALNIQPTVFHLNEGHCAFATLALAAEGVRAGESFDAALAMVRSQTVFTTHTPVPAGHDRFSPALTLETLGTIRDELGLSDGELLALGREDADDGSERFCMTLLAMRGSARTNGVSALHGEVSREMWRGLWPDLDVDDVPIGHVTNGVHVPTFAAPELAAALRDRRGADWHLSLLRAEEWEELSDAIDDDELLRLKRTWKLRLIETLQQRAARDSERPGALPPTAPGSWSPEALTIGFARRFATYKRGALLFSEIERAARLLADADRPVQVVFAGKAHPKDIPGQQVLRAVVQAASDPRLAERVVFVEEYDMGVARALVAGVDIWLNNPRRTREASGTSGQKVTFHGGLNFSTLDGWWPEGYDGENGFAIGTEEMPGTIEELDARDQESLYHVLEAQIIPAYYEGDRPGASAGWLRRMRAAFRRLPAQFSSHRMLSDYVTRFYDAAHAAGEDDA